MVSAIYFFKKNKKLEICQLLVDHDADVNAENDEGKTPLSIALKHSKRNKEIIELFLKNGAKIKRLQHIKFLASKVSK